MSGPFSRWKERWLIWLLCAAAGLRVFVYAAAFPFFNNVDEPAHFDLVMKYSLLRMPRAMEDFSPESIPSIVLFSSPEYLLTPDQFPDGKYPAPRWLHPDKPVGLVFAGSPSWWETHPNHESTGGPLYYMVAGMWARLGRWCGLENIYLLYWIRFLNIPLAAALVWLGYAAARMVFPGRIFPRLGVPMLLAFFPQEIFYSIQSDTLSPLCFGAAFVGLARWLQTDAPSPRLGALTGLALAAAWLVKATNMPLVAVAVLAVMIKSLAAARAGRVGAALPALALLLLCAALPIGGWCLWSRHAFGDLTGASAKIQYLGWTRKPFLDWWRHPIFTPSGLGTFLSELLAGFWRGEFFWGRRPLAMPGADAFYWISSLLLPGLAVAGLFRKGPGLTGWQRASGGGHRAPLQANGGRASRFRIGSRLELGRSSSLALPDDEISGLTSGQRQALWLAFWCFAASVAFLGLASIAFDFGQCVNPSRAHPYFTSGRLLCGALIPFLLLYAHGLDRALGLVKSRAGRTLALGGIVLCVAVLELVLNLPAFSSQYNWFHL